MTRSLEAVTGWITSAYESFPADWHPLLKVGIIAVAALLMLHSILWLSGIVWNELRRYLGNPVKWWRAYLVRRKSPYGKAHFARLKDLRNRRIFGDILKPRGLFLGRLRGKFGRGANLYHHGEGHILTIAAPGGGKTSGALIPSLLTCDQGSFVVTDPKGEITAITRRHREALGSVVYLNPFQKDFEKGTGLVYPDTGFNPFDALDTSDPNFPAQASNFARFLCVTDRKESGSYFNDDGAELLALLISWIAKYEVPENRNLPYLYEITRKSPERTFHFIDHINDPTLDADAERFREMYQIAPQQWAGVVSKAHLATKRYVPTTPLADHVSRSGFDPKTLKKENVTVYILLPSKHIKLGAPWLNMVIGLLGEAVGDIGKSRPVTFLLDELPALGYLPDLRDQMRQYRTSGLRMWLFSQTASALSSPELYGDAGLKDIFGLCGTKQFFSIEEMQLAKEISEICGETTRLSSGLNTGNTAAVGVPLIRPEEVYNLKKGQQILIRPDNAPPIKGSLVPYFTRREWRKQTDLNPYRSK